MCNTANLEGDTLKETLQVNGGKKKHVNEALCD